MGIGPGIKVPSQGPGNRHRAALMAPGAPGRALTQSPILRPQRCSWQCRGGWRVWRVFLWASSPWASLQGQSLCLVPGLWVGLLSQQEPLPHHLLCKSPAYRAQGVARASPPPTLHTHSLVPHPCLQRPCVSSWLYGIINLSILTSSCMSIKTIVQACLKKKTRNYMVSVSICVFVYLRVVDVCYSQS